MQRTIAVGEGKAASRDQLAETLGCHRLQQGVLVRVVEIKGGPVQGGLVRDFLN